MKRFNNMRTVLLIPIAFVCVGVPIISHGSINTDAKSYIAAAYRSMDRAARHKDVRGALAYNVAHFVSIGPHGEQGGPSQADMTSFLFAKSKIVSGTTAIQSLVVSGTSAVVRVKKHQELAMASPDPETSVCDKYVLDSIRQDRWGKLQNGWMRLSSRELTVHETRNGQPIPTN